MRAAGLLGAVAALVLSVTLPAWAVTNGEGDLVTRFDGGLRPTLLPRSTPAPIAVHVDGDVESSSADAEALPQLRRIVVGINREGRLFDRGLPVCHARDIQPASEAGARAICGGAIVGSGHVTVQVRIPAQPPFEVHAKLLAFNGPRENGRKLILAQAYARKPPGAFILDFQVSRRSGTFGTVLSTSLPPATRKWAYLTHFDMTLHRVYRYHGLRRSYVSAACPAPAGFDTALFPFARATYSFASGQRLTMSVAKTCHVRAAGGS